MDDPFRADPFGVAIEVAVVVAMLLLIAGGLASGFMLSMDAEQERREVIIINQEAS